jgi:hypothetical protein
VDENANVCVFDAPGTVLRVTLFAGVAHPGYTVLGWRVTDIDDAVGRLESAGVLLSRFDGMDQDAHGVWSTPNGDCVARFADPGGDVLSLSELH